MDAARHQLLIGKRKETNMLDLLSDLIDDLTLEKDGLRIVPYIDTPDPDEDFQSDLEKGKIPLPVIGVKIDF